MAAYLVAGDMELCSLVSGCNCGVKCYFQVYGISLRSVYRNQPPRGTEYSCSRWVCAYTEAYPQRGVHAGRETDFLFLCDLIHRMRFWSLVLLKTHQVGGLQALSWCFTGKEDPHYRNVLQGLLTFIYQINSSKWKSISGDSVIVHPNYFLFSCRVTTSLLDTWHQTAGVLPSQPLVFCRTLHSAQQTILRSVRARHLIELFTSSFLPSRTANKSLWVP